MSEQRTKKDRPRYLETYSGIPSGENGEEVRVSVAEINRRFFVDVRLWHGDQPTQHGMFLRVNQVSPLRKILEDAKDRAWEHTLGKGQQ